MSDSNTNPAQSSVQILQEINAGVLDPTTLDKPSRQQCIELLIAEGYTQAHISQVMKCSEKTVYRDMKEIQARNELSPGVPFAKQFIGDVFKKAMNHHSFLVRQARAKDATTGEKIQAEYAAWRVLKELVEKLQSLGYLPSRPQEIIGDIFHHLDGTGEESLVEIQKMIVELETVSQEQGSGNTELLSEIQKLKARIEKVEISSEVKKIVEKQREDNQQKEDSNV